MFIIATLFTKSFYLFVEPNVKIRSPELVVINTYFHNGGMEIQFNIVDRATRVDAQKHPEEHQDLVVRVSGFSAYFTTLMKTTQDEIIARTEYSNM